MKYKLFYLMFAIILMQCFNQVENKLYDSESLHVSKITNNVFVHTSYLDTKDFGKVACNGMLFKTGGEVVIFDTPTTDSVSSELIQWVQNELGLKIKAVIVGHFHEDCLGGLSAFHKEHIKSYASELTIQLARETDKVVPLNGFDSINIIYSGSTKIISEFIGEGHSSDNVVSYIPSEQTLFGGCLVKSIGSDEGYLGDSNPGEWSNTILKIKDRFSDAKFIVPGHGKHGEENLLDYTYQLFKKYKTESIIHE